MSEERIILGIDPGFAKVGYSVLRVVDGNLTILDFGIIQTSAQLDFAQRLHILFQDLNGLIERFRPNEAYIEELFFSSNTKTALAVAHGRGVILSCLASHDIPMKTFTPNEVKLGVTGDGRADKRQIQTMLQRHFSLREIPKPDDAADALAVALCGSLLFLKS